MLYDLKLTPEDLDELRTVLRQELDDSRGELHYTANPDYRGQVIKPHIDRISGLLQQIEQVMQPAHD